MKKSSKSQKGLFLIEMIVVLALLAIFAPIIYKIQVDKKEKEVNITNAQQISQVISGMNSFMTKYSANIADTNAVDIGGMSFAAITNFDEIDDGKVIDTHQFNLADTEALTGFLPPGLQDFNPNRLFSSFILGINRVKVGDDISVSAMLAAVPKTTMSEERLIDITGMLGAAGGYVDNNVIIGNSGLWQVNLTDFFSTSSGVTTDAIVGNIDYYVSERAVSADASSSDGVVSSSAEYINRTGSGVNSDGSSSIMTTMDVNLEMGTGSGNTDERFSFTNVEVVYGHQKTETCDSENASEFCLQHSFDNNMGGKTEFGTDCTASDTCITVNGNVEISSTYLINPTGTTVLEDVRIGALDGASLTELIPPMILLEVHRGVTQATASSAYPTVTMEGACPTGYLPTTAIVPTAWEDVSNDADVTLTGWPFYAMNMKANSNSSYIWGTGYSCADMHFSENNVLALYLSGSNVSLAASIGSSTETIGGLRNSETNGNFDVYVDSSSSAFIDPSKSVSCLYPSSYPGKLRIDFNQTDRCGMTNLSTAFACNEEILYVAQRDFVENASAALLRWEFYQPPAEVNGEYVSLNLHATTEPMSKSISVTYPDGSTGNVMQTRDWTLIPSSHGVEYDVYIYCKYVVQSFQ